MTRRSSDTPSNAHRQSAAVVSAYTREMLDHNPMWDAARIVRRRRELLAHERDGAVVPTTSATLAYDPTANNSLRDRARSYLEVLQTQFYDLPDDKLRRYIKFLNHNQLPEFAAVATRLQSAAEVRSVVLAASHETNDVKFAFSLQQSLVRPATEAATLREQYIESIQADCRVVPSCAMVKQYLSAHPELYSLERDWFDALLDPKNQQTWSASYALSTRTRNLLLGSGGICLCVAVLVIAFTFQVAASVNRAPSRASQKNQLPTTRSPATTSYIGDAPLPRATRNGTTSPRRISVERVTGPPIAPSSPTPFPGTEAYFEQLRSEPNRTSKGPFDSEPSRPPTIQQHRDMVDLMHRQLQKTLESQRPSYVPPRSKTRHNERPQALAPPSRRGPNGLP